MAVTACRVDRDADRLAQDRLRLRRDPDQAAGCGRESRHLRLRGARGRARPAARTSLPRARSSRRCDSSATRSPRRDPERPLIGTVVAPRPLQGHPPHDARGRPAHRGVPRTAASSPPADPCRPYPTYPDELEQLARELGIEDRVELPGHVSDVASVYERLDVFMSATYLDDEGFGLEGLGAGILEASWARVPVVVARSGGSVEAMSDGVSGTLVESVEPEALAAGVAPYLRDPELARRTGRPWTRVRDIARNRAARGRGAHVRLDLSRDELNVRPDRPDRTGHMDDQDGVRTQPSGMSGRCCGCAPPPAHPSASPCAFRLRCADRTAVRRFDGRRRRPAAVPRRPAPRHVGRCLRRGVHPRARPPGRGRRRLRPHRRRLVQHRERRQGPVQRLVRQARRRVHGPRPTPAA